MEWNQLISDCRQLNTRKNSIDPWQPVRLDYSFKYTNDGFYEPPSSVCSISNKIILGSRDCHTIQIFDSRGNLLSTFENDEGVLGIGTLGDYILISDTDSGGVQVYNENFDPLYSISTGDIYPRRICSTRKGYILARTSKDTILVLSRDGQLIRQFGSKGKNPDQLTGTEGICSNSKDEIIVANKYNNCIQIFNENGQFLYQFGSTGLNQLCYPGGICTDEYDNIYVGDCLNNRICIFTREGTPIQQIPLSHPRDVCLLKRRLVAVSYHNDLASVFCN